uniref:RNA-directed DNA polymerase; Ribonuclease H, related n=1 Tax=Medicago truncatula TaxID=3880 RepID=Q1SL06_MEDTR|nr:RNA-directed DNA polymerase; Ribonuclease H, related [Medicago truncatula]
MIVDPNPLGEVHKTSLLVFISNKEIYQALMSMKSYKVPGLDEFQPIFYKMFWEVIGNNVCSFVSSTFKRGIVDPYYVATLMMFIFIVDNPHSLKKSRLFNFCDVNYKLVSKF